MDSYARYRMTDWNWIAIYKEKMGVDQFREYVNGVYNELLKYESRLFILSRGYG